MRISFIQTDMCGRGIIDEEDDTLSYRCVTETPTPTYCADHDHEAKYSKSAFIDVMGGIQYAV